MSAAAPIVTEQEFRLLTHLESGATTADLDPAIARLDSGLIRGASAILVRVPEPLVSHALGAAAAVDRQAALQRARGKQVLLLAYSAASRSHSVFRLTPTGIDSEPQSNAIIASARQHDLLNVLGSSTAAPVLVATERMHYVAPSGRHCQRFMRTADLLTSRHTIDSMAFWLLPFIPKRGAILLDTWAIGSVAYRAMQLSGVDLAVDAIDQHPNHDRGTLRPYLEEFTARHLHEGELLMLSSLSDTGETIRSIAKILGQVLDPGVRISSMALYSTPLTSSDIPRLCNLPEEFSSVEPRECGSCRGEHKSEAVRIDPRLFYIRQVSEREVRLQPRHTGDVGAILEKLASVSGILRVHRSGPNDSRHFAFDVDILGALDQAPVREDLVSRLRALSPVPDIVITPSHDAADRLRQIAQETLGCFVYAHNDLSVADCPNDVKERLRSAKHVLVLDDVVTSGARFSEYLRNLREHYAGFARVTFVVVLERMRDRPAVEEFRRSLSSHTWPMAFEPLYSLHLPPPGREHCPWCTEYEHLNRIKPFASPPKWLRSRKLALQGRRRGLVGDALLMFDDVVTPTLASGAHFGSKGADPVQVLFAVAAALQELRADPSARNRLQPAFPFRTVLGRGTLSAYSESLLRACILRVASPIEWGEREQSRTWKYLSAEIELGSQSCLRGEMLFAAIRRSFLVNAALDIPTSVRTASGIPDNSLDELLGERL